MPLQCEPMQWPWLWPEIVDEVEDPCASQFSWVQLSPRAAAGKRFSTKEAMPDSPAKPLADITVDTPAISVDGAFDGALDIDYVRIKTPKAGRLFVTVAVDSLDLSNAATSVALLQSDCTTL